MDRSATCCPDLHFNRSTLFQYEEMYGAALEGYSRAAALNPGWDEPVDKEKQLLDYLRKVTDLMDNKVGTHDYLVNCTKLLLISYTNAKKVHDYSPSFIT